MDMQARVVLRVQQASLAAAFASWRNTTACLVQARRLLRGVLLHTLQRAFLAWRCAQSTLSL